MTRTTAPVLETAMLSQPQQLQSSNPKKEDDPDGKNKDFIENLHPKVLALKAELDMAQSFNVDSVSQNKNLIEEISSSFMI